MRKGDRTTSVLRDGGLSAYLETKVLNQSLGFFSNLGAENRHLAKPKDDVRL